jgi:hypothetical protein
MSAVDGEEEGVKKEHDGRSTRDDINASKLGE